MGSNLSNKTVKSANWSIGKTMGQNVIAFFATIVLARLIAPEEFGLLAIAMIFVGLGKIVSNVGINNAIIQKKRLTSKNLRAALILSLLAGGVIYFCIWLIAPLAAEFFSNTRAESVIRWIGLIFLFNGFTTVGQGLLMRHFRYRPIFFIELFAFTIGYGAGGIILATMGFGVWSLVYGVLIQYGLMAVLYLFFVRISFIPVVRGGEYRRLFRFGSGVSLLGLFNYSATNIDNLIIGRLLDANQLGLYSKAFGLMHLPIRNLSFAVGGVSMSTFSAIQEDQEQLKKAYLKAVDLIFLIACPITVIMILSSEYLILGLYGPQWNGAIGAFTILSFSIVFKVFFGLSGSLAKSTDNVFKETWRQFLFATSLGVLSLLFIEYGIEGVAAAVTISSLLFFIMMTQLSLKICNASWPDFFKKLKGGAILALIIGITNLVSIFLIEAYISGLGTPFKLALLLSVLLLSGMVSFFKLPDRLIGNNRNWLLETYLAMLPVKFETLLKKYLL